MARGGGSAARADHSGAADVRTPLVPVTGGRRFETPPRSARLSGKELGVMRELARGYTTEEVALAFHVSPHTIRTHVKNGMRKLGARTRAHAVAIVLTEGTVDLDEP